MSTSWRLDPEGRRRPGAAASPQNGPPVPSDADPAVWLEVARELVVSLSGGPRLLVAAIDAINHPPLLRVLARLRAGARQPTGTARWIPERRGATLSAMRLSAQLVGDPSTVLQLRFPLPRCEWTLGVFPDRIALTDLAGFVEMERTRALPCAVLLPPSVRDVLAEHLPGRAASA